MCLKLRFITNRKLMHVCAGLLGSQRIMLIVSVMEKMTRPLPSILSQFSCCAILSKCCNSSRDSGLRDNPTYYIYTSALSQNCVFIEHGLNSPWQKNVQIVAVYLGNWNFRSHVLSLPGTKVPRLELSFPGTCAPWNFRPLELSLRRAKIT